MGRGGEEEAVLEPVGQVADRAGELGLDPVLAGRRRRGVVGLVENQQAARQALAEPFPHRFGVGGVAQQVVGDEEPGVGAPRVRAETALAAHLGDIAAVEHLEDESEPLFHLGPPLVEHRRRRRHDHLPRLAAEEEFLGDEAGLDGLAEAGVVGDEQVDAGEAEGLPQGLHLVGVEPDAGAERRLEEIAVGGGDAVPEERPVEGGELPGFVELPLRETLPAVVFEDPAVRLVVPEDFERLAGGVVLGAGEADDGGLVRRRWGLDLLDDPLARSHLHQGALGRRRRRQRGELPGGRRVRRVHRRRIVPPVGSGANGVAAERGGGSRGQAGWGIRRRRVTWPSFSQGVAL